MNRNRKPSRLSTMLSSRIDDAFLSHASDVLTNGALTGTLLARYFMGYAVQFKRSIPFTSSNFNIEGKMLAKRDAFKMNLERFEDAEQYYIINSLCKLPGLKEKEVVQKLHIDLIQRFSELNYIEPEDEKLDLEIIKQSKHWLKDYPNVLKVYNDAMEKYALRTFHRNILDDLRVALEKLLREIFKNDAPLEKQIAAVGEFIKKAGGNQDFTNMFHTLITYFAKYQNNYIKHDDKVNPLELEFMVEFASILMKAFVKFASK